MSDKPSVVQFKPPRAEELAQIFDDFAARARSGDVIGYSALLILPGGKHEAHGWQAEGVNAFQEVGMLWTTIMETWSAMRSD